MPFALWRSNYQKAFKVETGVDVLGSEKISGRSEGN